MMRWGLCGRHHTGRTPPLYHLQPTRVPRRVERTRFSSAEFGRAFLIAKRIRCIRSASTNGADGGDSNKEGAENDPGDGLGTAGVEVTTAATAVGDEEEGDEGEKMNSTDDDDELEPLMGALERAKEKVMKASFKRQALEAEAQQVAELSVEASEAYQREQQELQEAADSLNSKRSLREKLLETLERVAGEKNELEDVIKQHAEKSMEEREEAALSLESMAPDSLLTEAEADADEDSYKSVSELREELQGLDEVSNAATIELTALSDEISRLKSKISILNARVGYAKRDADDAESTVEAVMAAAADAVTAELEAQAVMKETEVALEKATSEIEALAPEAATEAEEEIVMEDVVAPDPLRDTVDVTDTRMAGDISVLQLDTEARVADVEQPTKTQLEKEPAEKDQQVQSSVWEVFVDKYGKAVAVALASAVVCTLLLKTATGQAVVAKGTAVLGKGFAWLQNLVSRITPDAYGVEKGLMETIWLLAASVVVVPLVVKGLPGGTPVLGFLAAGALIGPHALGIVKNVEGVRHLAEMGVVFLLFNIGLELSLERLRSMAKLVFGLGNAQVLVTTAAVALVSGCILGISGPGAVILGSSLALSSTAVAIQVLQDRGESGSRHGRATFSILLLQDLAVVVVLMLIPLLAPRAGAADGGIGPIAKALGVAGAKAVVCMTSIIIGGRVLLRPLYRFFASFENEEIFAALTLLIVLGTSELTKSAGLSLALGAFLAGLLVAETEYALQVESDIAPYKGLLMGLFFMTVGMEISVGLLIAKWQEVFVGMCALLIGKVAVLALVGPLFGLSQLTSIRAGMLLAAGGEFAFVAFGEAVAQGILPAKLVNEMYLMVALSMALIPYMAIAGAKLGKYFEKSDMKALQPSDKETGSLKDHIIIAGFGRVGTLISQLLSKRMIPFVALDVQVDAIQAGKAQDLPVYFGDAGSHKVLHSVGAERAACVVVALDSPGANYRCVWGMRHHFPHVKTFVRAYDVDHARNLEKAGATAVIPETLEPSIQLAASVLAQVKIPSDEIVTIIEDFRADHLAELQQLSEQFGFSLGYGYQRNKVEEDDSMQADVSLEAEEPQAMPAPVPVPEAA